MEYEIFHVISKTILLRQSVIISVAAPIALKPFKTILSAKDNSLNS